MTERDGDCTCTSLELKRLKDFDSASGCERFLILNGGNPALTEVMSSRNLRVDGRLRCDTHEDLQEIVFVGNEGEANDSTLGRDGDVERFEVRGVECRVNSVKGANGSIIFPFNWRRGRLKLLIVERAEDLFIGQGSAVWIGGEPVFINDAMMQ